MPSHFLQVCDLPGDSLFSLFAQAQELEIAFQQRTLPPLLKGKRIALSFEDGGFRNRVAFDLGIRLLGGEAVFIPGRPGLKEPAADMMLYLNNWFDAVVVRTPDYKVLEDMARVARVPVVNARTTHNHPCEIIGDLAFVQKMRGKIDGLKVVYVGEPTNLSHSWFEAGASLPIEIVQVCPQGYEIDSVYWQTLKRKGAGTLRISHDLCSELRNAHVVYTDCWPSRPNPQVAGRVARAFAPYQITAVLLETTPADCLFLPCPPVTRGEELSADAMLSPRCQVYAAKEYLLHAQNALLATLLK